MVLRRDRDALVLRLVKRFARRQKLVLDLIRDVRPYMLSELPVRPSKEVLVATAKGTWGASGEWRFHMHGPACKMVHVVTGEPLDFQPPDLNRFDMYWFLAWLEWYFSQPGLGPDVESLRQHLEAEGIGAGLKNALEHLVDLGVLERARRPSTAYVLRTRKRAGSSRRGSTQ